MTHTEGALVGQSAINLFKDAGWQTRDCFSETFGEESQLSHDNHSEVILVRELREALSQIKDYPK